ncbi:MAG: glycosyltransferase family 39 protein [Opitutaceae bacterium]|nr:glycosyltransferase family 39 protein [Opitutaceae bacterium]
MPGPATTSIAPPADKRRRGPPLPATIAAAVLLVIHFALAVGSKFEASTTSDELVHLTAGVNHWHNHDYRLHPENGILPQRWAALPAWLGGAKFPALAGNDYWRTSDAWVIGHQFFYETGEDHFPRLMAGRAMIALFSVGTGLLIFLWSWRIFGAAGALVSLILFVFSPDFLAHGALVTSDTCMVFFFLAAGGSWWRHLHDGRARTWWLSAVVLGLAFVAKFSAVLLIPMMAIMAAVRAFAPEPLHLGGRVFLRPAGKLVAATASAIGHAVVTALIIWAFYGFRFSAFNPALPGAFDFIVSEKSFAHYDRLSGQLIRAATSAHLLPQAFLFGFSYVLETARMRSAFLNGEYSLTGWKTFFLWTFFLKSTVPVLLITAGLAGLAVRRAIQPGHLRAFYRFTPLLALFGVYWLFSITSQLNIGHRHILPIYPVIFIGAGVVGPWLFRRRIAAVGIGLLLGWHVCAAAWIAPYFLAYFNPVAGGPQNGWRHLVDSSLDWGQDLPGLKKWLDRHAGNEPVFLSYFGTGQPGYYKIDARRLGFINHFKFPVTYEKLEPGWYCISATLLQEVYSASRGRWTDERERDYQQLRALEPTFEIYTRDPAQREELERNIPAAQWQAMIARHDSLRFARLAPHLRLRKADAQVGYSILIYRLTAEEVRGATAGPASEWNALIEKAASHP